MDILQRSRLFFKEEKLKTIANSSILVAGVGALGCVVAEILVRLSVGRLVIVDRDVVSASDLGRQLLYNSNDLDKPKVEVAKERLSVIGSNTAIEPYFLDITAGGMDDLLKSVDGVVDCLDNFASRFFLEDLLPEKTFMVHGGIKYNFGQITTIVKDKTQALGDIYAGIEDSSKPIGVAPTAVFVIGGLMAEETLNNIFGKPHFLNKLLIVDLGDFSCSVINLE
ncbi:HesA/MoeB/ThiF family protein [Hippea jasoniae]|uniref:HesA/MoeB/ThiF family protein n=1 Tax=Hippea jasoniae TaxID=944479 RepID=UPI00068A875A|nr:HesA/MoeB/ThiF family protein [Hippea jasoniae]